MVSIKCIFCLVVMFNVSVKVYAQGDGFTELLTDMTQVKDALIQGYPLRFFADFSKCSRTPVVTIPGVDIEEPSDFGTVLDSYRGLRDVTGVPIQLTFTTTEIILFPGIMEHVIVHTTIQALTDGTVSVVSHYIERSGVTEVGNSINDCILNDGTNDQGVFIYKNTAFEPVRLTTYSEMENAFMEGYSIRYQADFSQCGEFNIGTGTLGGGLIPLFYLKRGEKIITSLVKFYNSPFSTKEYVADTFKVDIYSNLTMQITLATVNIDDFSDRYSEEVFNCLLADSPPPAAVFKMVPQLMTTQAPKYQTQPADTNIAVDPTGGDSAGVKIQPIIGIFSIAFSLFIGMFSL